VRTGARNLFSVPPSVRPSFHPSVLQAFEIMNLQSLMDPLHGYRVHAKYIPKQYNISAEKALIYLHARNGNCNHDPFSHCSKTLPVLYQTSNLIFTNSFHNYFLYIFLKWLIMTGTCVRQKYCTFHIIYFCMAVTHYIPYRYLCIAEILYNPYKLLLYGSNTLHPTQGTCV
jgi:hypothetical protein